MRERERKRVELKQIRGKELKYFIIYVMSVIVCTLAIEDFERTGLREEGAPVELGQNTLPLTSTKEPSALCSAGNKSVVFITVALVLNGNCLKNIIPSNDFYYGTL